MEFKQSVITQQGRNLMAKLLSNQSTATFTKIATSTKVYSDTQLETLTDLSEIIQTTPVQVRINNGSTVTVEGGIENTGIKNGYYINTVGLYAKEYGKSEILYSVAAAKVNGYIPADTGVSKTGVLIKIYTEIGNASQVNLVVDPASYATKNDIEHLRDDYQKPTTAFANSADGTTDFVTKIPNENLVNDYEGGSERHADNNWMDTYRFLNNSVVNSRYSGRTTNYSMRAEVELLRVDDDTYDGSPLSISTSIQLKGSGAKTYDLGGVTKTDAMIGDKWILVGGIQNFTFATINYCRLPVKFNCSNKNAVLRITKLSFVEGDEPPEIALPQVGEADPLQLMFKYRGIGLIRSYDPTQYVWSLCRLSTQSICNN